MQFIEIKKSLTLIKNLSSCESSVYKKWFKFINKTTIIQRIHKLKKVIKIRLVKLNCPTPSREPANGVSHWRPTCTTAVPGKSPRPTSRRSCWAATAGGWRPQAKPSQHRTQNFRISILHTAEHQDKAPSWGQSNPLMNQPRKEHTEQAIKQRRWTRPLPTQANHTDSRLSGPGAFIPGEQPASRPRRQTSTCKVADKYIN